MRSLINCSALQAADVVEHFEFRTFDKNDFLVHEGEVSNFSYFIEEGICRSYVYDTEGVDVTVQFFTKNTFASDFNSLFNRVRSQEDVQALTPLKTWCISLANLQTDFHNKPMFREMGRAMLVQKVTRLKQLMVAAKKMSGQERYAQLLRESPEIIQVTPQRMIASFIGITESSLSRIRRKLS